MKVLPGFDTAEHPGRPGRQHFETLRHGAMLVTFLPGLAATTRY